MLRICTHMFALFFFVSLACADTAIHHKFNATVDPENHFIEVTDQITIPAEQTKPLMHFILNSNLTVISETPGVVVALDRAGVKAEGFGMDREDFNFMKILLKINTFNLSYAKHVQTIFDEREINEYFIFLGIGT